MVAAKQRKRVEIISCSNETFCVFPKQCFPETPSMVAANEKKDRNHFVLKRNGLCFPETMFSRNTIDVAGNKRKTFFIEGKCGLKRRF
jgi:hypothetical protein